VLSTYPLFATSFGNWGLPFSGKNAFHLNLNLQAQCFVLRHGVMNDTLLMYKVTVEVAVDVYVANFMLFVVGYKG
jgi:hypothetical protein